MAVMSLSVNIQRLPGSRGKSDAILGKEIKREEGELVAGGVFPLYSHFWKTFKIHGDSWCILYILLQNIVLI